MKAKKNDEDGNLPDNLFFKDKIIYLITNIL